MSKPLMIVVTGSESSGTRLLQDALIGALGFSGDDPATEKLWSLVPTIEEYEKALEKNGGIEHRGPILDGTIKKALGRYDRVTRRSLPHGPLGRRPSSLYARRRFHDPVVLSIFADALGFDVRFVVTTRDGSIVTKSKTREHTRGDELFAAQELAVAEEILSGLLSSNLHVEIFSYETYMSLGRFYFDYFLGRLGVRSRVKREIKHELRDGNAKYLK